MGAIKNVLIDIESTMLDASLRLADAVCESGDVEMLETTAKEVRERMQTIIDLFEMVNS